MFGKRRSIQSLLSRYFVLFSLILLFLTVTLLSWVQYRSARADGMDALKRTSIAVADSVALHLNQMDQISQNAITFSDFQTVLESYTSHTASAYERAQQRTRLVSLLSTARGLDFSIRQLNVYTMPRQQDVTNGYGVGEYYGDLPVCVDTLPWYQNAREAAGHMIISVPEDIPEDITGETSKTLSGKQETPYLSVCSMFYNIFHSPVGFTEVKKYYTDVFSLAQAQERPGELSVTVYDKDGNLLYPISSRRFDYFSNYAGEDVTLTNTLTGEKELVSYARSDRYQLLIAASTPQGVLLRQVLNSMAWIVPAFFALFVLAFLISLLLSKRISQPIRSIYHFLSEDQRDRFALLSMPKTGIREIDKLTASINDSIQSTAENTKTLMTLKEQEVQAQMLAMQAQMNPHFLYNSLSTVGEMAEEGLTRPIAQMCQEITEIMRYISSNREQRCSLQEELEICDMYLDCIRMRYGEQLVSSICVPDEMLDLKIPKLCAQLLVENAVRSVTKSTPPWHVDVSCRIKDGNWYVTVRDTGLGFDPNVEENLRRKMDDILATGTLPGLQIQGMGILNIFIRLYLLEGIPFIFDLGNNADGGAFVTIGGSMEKQE